VRPKGGLAASDVIRSMMRCGFDRDEIYDVLVGIGLPGEQVHLLIDRVSAELEEMELEPRPSKLEKTLQKTLEEALARIKIELFAELAPVVRKINDIAEMLESLESRETKKKKA